MQAAHMTFEEEVIKLRTENKLLRQKTAWLEQANEKLSKKVILLEKENKELKQENALLKQKQKILLEKQAILEKQVESLQLIVEELRGMVFRKKTKKEDSDTSSETGSITGKRKSANRSKQSYRRTIPSEVTETIHHYLTHCPDCGTLLSRLKEITRYIEDIADLTQLPEFLKRIEKHLIASGYCHTCKSRKIAKEISPQMVTLGENVEKFVSYLCVIMRLSFEQIRCFLKDTANFDISDGEITRCLDEQAKKLTPEKDRLFAKIRGAPGRHYDETGWKVQKGGEGNYAWTTRPTIGEETIFLMGKSRGKGNAEELRGNIDNQIGISDDYAAYDNLFEKHQLCMAHPQRKLRDLAKSETLVEQVKKVCGKTYSLFSELYKELKETLTDYDQNIWLQKRDDYIKQLKKIAVITPDDPQKLRRIKQSLSQNADKYFTCLLQQGIPPDNNKAERGLRHIVLKRKISYGSKSQKGADTMSILCSTLLSAWWNKPKNFFVAYNEMLAV